MSSSFWVNDKTWWACAILAPHHFQMKLIYTAVPHCDRSWDSTATNFLPYLSCSGCKTWSHKSAEWSKLESLSWRYSWLAQISTSTCDLASPYDHWTVLSHAQHRPMTRLHHTTHPCSRPVYLDSIHYSHHCCMLMMMITTVSTDIHWKPTKLQPTH